jgi:thiamine pyrophosphate-dependent acetolactate synthase large subunit-like protein
MKQTGGSLVIRFLEVQGVEVIFGIPGGHTLSLNDALIESSISFIATRHEYGAACAAAAWGRLRRRPGICMATCGPGMTNLATGLAAAMRDSNPVIALTVNNTLRDMGWEDAQHADAVAVLNPLVKWSYQVRHPEEISDAIGEAFRISMSGKPGPVHLDFARDVLEKGDAFFKGPAAIKVNSPQKNWPDPVALQSAIALLHNAQRPVIWAGNGVRSGCSADELIQLAEDHSCALLTTFNGIGSLPTTHPQVFGCRSRVGTRLSNEILAEADLVIAVGNSLNGISTSRWSLKLPTLIQIDIDPTRIGRRYNVDAAVVGDADVVIKTLREVAPGPLASKRKDWLAQLSLKKTGWLTTALSKKAISGEPLLPQEIIVGLNYFGRDDTVWCVDASNCGIWTHLLTIRKGMDYMRPVNFSNMGFALPAAIGAKLAQPGRDVVVLAGDGGLSMSLAEIETAVRLKLSLPIIVMNDSGYGNIRQEQMHKFGPRYNGVDLGDIRFHDVCIAMGGAGVRVNSGQDLIKALDMSRNFAGPFVVDITTDPNESIWESPF